MPAFNLNANPQVPFKANGVAHPLPRSGAPRVILGTIVFGVLSFAAFSATGRIAQEADPAMAIHGSQKLVMPWDDASLHDTGGKRPQFQYRYRTAEGHMEDAPPALARTEFNVGKDGKVKGDSMRQV